MIRLESKMVTVIGLIVILAMPLTVTSQECIQVKKLKVPAVHGRVVTSWNGKPEESIPNVEIELRQELNDEWKTLAKVNADGAGAFDIPNVSPGKYDIYARTDSLRAWARITVVKSSAHDAEKTLLVLMVAPVPSDTCGTARVEKRKPG
jgi:hypothetical protein